MFALIRNFFNFHKKGVQLQVLWTVPVAFKEKLTLDDARFIFYQAERLLAESLATGETIVTRMNTLITLISGSLLAIIGYIISRIGENLVFNSALFTAGVGGLYLYVLVIYSFQNNQPKDYLLTGTLPEILFDQTFFNSTTPNSERIVLYYVNEAQNYMYRININKAINKERLRLYSKIVKALLWLPVILACCYLSTSR